MANKKEVLYVKWVLEYCIKGRNILLIKVPTQASWVVKKVFNAATNFANAYDNVRQTLDISIRKMYNILRGDLSNVRWSEMICNNPTLPKCLFVNWLAIHARLPTCKWVGQC